MSCTVTYTFEKFSSNTANTYGIVECDAPTQIYQQISGDHCVLYSFGSCDVWNQAWSASSTACSATGTIGYCPPNGQYFWRSIPSGWLVRGVDSVCANIITGLMCANFPTPGVQF